jgi:tungstate transport system permease protein
MTADVLALACRSLLLSSAAVTLAAAGALPLAVAIGLRRTRAARTALVVARIAMALPTVAVGLVVYAALTRYGPLGDLDLLYTPAAIVLGEVLLAFPVIVALGASAVADADPRFRDTVRVLGLRGAVVTRLAVAESREGLVAALVAAFARCVTELGVALLVGGNLAGAGFLGSTRTLTTAIATDTSRGDFRRALVLGGVLVLVAVFVNLCAELLRRSRA